MSDSAAAGHGEPHEFAGQRLGLPETGVDSLASVMRRVGGTAIDWFIAKAIVHLFFGYGLSDPAANFPTFGLWVAMGIVSVWLFSFTAGQLALGMRVVRVGANERVGLVRAAIRTVLVALVIPAFFLDRDGRGLQDQVSGTGVVRTR